MRTSGRRFQAEETAGMKVLRQELPGISKEQRGRPTRLEQSEQGGRKEKRVKSQEARSRRAFELF